ncbi:MAG: hypothetical protein AAFX65_07585 [Cyanobacteria bacterium J06638_7]
MAPAPPRLGPPHRRHRQASWLAALILAAALLLAPLGPGPLSGLPAVLAAPVNWHEVPPTEAGRQWWDAGSLRLSRAGNLSVLSRFQPAAASDDERPRLGDLYVMEIDCGQTLYRDSSVNGLPRWGAEWQPADGDPLLMAVIRESCEAAAPLLQAG